MTESLPGSPTAESESPSTRRQLHFVEQGLLGFETELDYELSPHNPETPFYWLRSCQTPDLAFLVMEPHLLLADYGFDLPEEEASRLQIQNSEEAFVLVLLTVPDNPLEMTANLLGPLVFNKTSNQGRQIVLEQSPYSLRYPLFNNAETEA